MPTDFQLLGYFLTIEGFLLAAVSLSASLGTPDQKRPSLLPFNVHWITIIAAAISGVAGAGAVISWFGVYINLDGKFLSLPNILQATFLIIAAIAQPTLALFLSLAVLKKRKK